MTDYKPKSEFLHQALERGYLFQCTDLEGFDQLLLKEQVSAYVGFDCTAPSLHVGNLLSIMLMRLFQNTGHRPISLMGAGTTKVGDPSGKDKTRQLLTEEKINENLTSIQSIFERLLNYDSKLENAALMANNADWLEGLGYIEMLREIGPHFTLNRMLTYESVKSRLDREQPLTFLEFNYMVLQAYDFVELYRRHGVRAQFGGSDQWGNIVNGIELGRRSGHNEQLFGFTIPLLTTATGAKMGKTAEGALWLNPAMLSHLDYYQFWRNCDDRDVGRFLRLYTDLPLDEIRRLEGLKGAEINEAKKILAFEATSIVRGVEGANSAQNAARDLFEKGNISKDLPTVFFGSEEFEQGIALFAALQRLGLVASANEGRRLIKDGGARINDQKVMDANAQVTKAQLKEGFVKISAGKKKHALMACSVKQGHF